jgi:predicted phosphodiesterase
MTKEKKGNIYCIGDLHGNHKGLLQCLERSGFDNDVDTLISLGDVVDGHCESFEVVEELLKIKNLIAIKGNHDCLDEETEVFTTRGWLNYKLLTNSDYVIGINTSTGLSNWQKINEVVIKKSDHLNYYSNNKIDFAMTDGHRVLHKLNDTEYDYKLISDLKYNDRLKIPIGCKTENKGLSSLTDDEIRLTAWILTDGNISEKHGYITIYQSKVENLKHIEDILEKNGLIYTHFKRTKKTKSILGKPIKSIKEANEYKILAESSKKITSKLIKSKTKIPFWCYLLSQRQLEIFLKEIIRGDGSQYSSTDNYILYGTKNFLENMQPLSNMAGYSCNLTESNRKDFSTL